MSAICEAVAFQPTPMCMSSTVFRVDMIASRNARFWALVFVTEMWS
jgi:hypothetical protein